ncbi:hypothetical protein RHEC894_PC00161 (plasmid) [Rhizobium sp. CIAT894]|nr:hypothetical protein RHEC894_PC00161 [Rhizobium sp. CIAT894]
MPLQHTFVDEDQFLRIEIQLAVEPGAPALQDVRSVLLQCVCGLFLKVHPRPRSQAPSALRLIFTCRSTDKRSTISSSVTSLRSLINATRIPRVHPLPKVVSSPVAEQLTHPLSLLQSSGSPSKSQLRTELRPVEPTCPPQTLSKPVFQDHRSVLVPSSTSSLWMLNQLRWTPSHHNRFIDRRTCSRGLVAGRNSVAENDDALRTAPNENLPAASSL